MTPLTKDQKELIFDYCMGLATDEHKTEAERLVESNPSASQLYEKLKLAFCPLDSIKSADECPDDLVESTISRLNNLARSSSPRLEQLLAAEQTRPSTAKIGFWRSMGSRLATAALFIVVGGTAITVYNTLDMYADGKAIEYQCQMQMSGIYDGMNLYANDNDNKLPAVAVSQGAPWWRIGYQGRENYSNTRHLWLLRKQGYVAADDFICPGSKQKPAVRFSRSQIRNFNDFPSRNYISYSFRIPRSRSATKLLSSHKPLLSDLSPLFDAPPGCGCDSNSFNLSLNKKLTTSNSINHNRRGQNVLSGDGSIRFNCNRRTGLFEDDIFTLQNVSEYKGVEVPECETDTFLAP